MTMRREHDSGRRDDCSVRSSGRQKSQDDGTSTRVVVSPRSFTMSPSFTTACTREASARTAMFASGSLSTRIRSACLPSSMVPMLSERPKSSALVFVAATMAPIGPMTRALKDELACFLAHRLAEEVGAGADADACFHRDADGVLAG